MKGVYPWWQVADDIAKRNTLSQDDQTELATAVAMALLTSKLTPTSASGMPRVLTTGSIPTGKDAPYLFVTEVNKWLEELFPYVWTPPKTQKRAKLSRGRSKNSKSLRALKQSGELASEAREAGRGPR